MLVDFWTYSCINWLRTLPYVRAWAEKYKDQGLVVIGVHSPEFTFEKDIDNVRRAVAGRSASSIPVAIDNDYKIWRAFENAYWPALYFIDAQGRHPPSPLRRRRLRRIRAGHSETAGRSRRRHRTERSRASVALGCRSAAGLGQPAFTGDLSRLRPLAQPRLSGGAAPSKRRTYQAPAKLQAEPMGTCRGLDLA